MKRLILLTGLLLFTLIGYGQDLEKILINQIIERIDGVIIKTDESKDDSGNMMRSTFVKVSEYLTLNSIQIRIRTWVNGYSDVYSASPWKREQTANGMVYYSTIIAVDMETGNIDDDKLISISYTPSINLLLFIHKK